MTMDRPGKQALGRSGEDIAAQYLKKQKYRLLDRNYRCPAGEIDLILGKKEWLVFVEVKARTSADFGEPEEAVTGHKKKRILSAAEWYVAENRLEDRSLRFDVISVVFGEGKPPAVTHFPAAFEGE